ncbi:hypothetical protein H6F43_03455 [Leptolyngbya sp. FACHB-36]|uniref:hypothetical protein n=1 Tax=Leptolyngbya sp. FACHB-36 TaxID=2692808 RepID=UPI00168055AD|nr:hypothetical protein [Leptolyngbya sp. FACHB-36]MBD2019238.1 hypothetical protein [Leptolyngbya sp. FACHB-36]
MNVQFVRLLGKQQGFSVTFRNHQLSSLIVVQIHQMPPEQLGVILNAIASRVTRENL